jgi:hypothetical protein
METEITFPPGGVLPSARPGHERLGLALIDKIVEENSLRPFITVSARSQRCRLIDAVQ